MIREIVKTPSAALQYMVDGLRKQAQRPDFKVFMHTYGRVEDDTCFGCAATCAIQEIAGKNLVANDIENTYKRSQFLGFGYAELSQFEIAIDGAREGSLWRLFEFFDLSNGSEFNGRFFLDTDNWECELPKVELLIKELKELNL